MSQIRRCSRAGCPHPAVATLTYAHGQSTAYIGPLAPTQDVHSWDLCANHADRITAPLGWQLVRRFDDSDGPFSGDPNHSSSNNRSNNGNFSNGAANNSAYNSANNHSFGDGAFNGGAFDDDDDDLTALAKLVGAGTEEERITPVRTEPTYHRRVPLPTQPPKNPTIHPSRREAPAGRRVGHLTVLHNPDMQNPDE